MPPERIGKYRIDGKIGQGAMGEVWKAYDEVLGREVAIKTIVPESGGDDSQRQRFLREAQSAARLNHPNIITVYDFGEENGSLYMAMELLTGHDLRTLLIKRAVTGLEERLQIMEQVCDGLAFAHAQDIVHRDVKPANIHVQPGGEVRIVDFGLARVGGSEMTRTGTVMGTPHYMSPEQVRGERADTRSDVFAAGAVFYELLTGRKPFEADSMHAVLFKVMQEDPAAAKEVSPEVPLVLSEILVWALAKDPEERYQDAGRLRAALQLARQAIADGRGDEPLAEPPARQRSGQPTLNPTTPGAAGSEPSRYGSRPGSRPGARPASRPGGPAAPGSGRSAVQARAAVAAEAPSRTPLLVAGGVTAAVVVVAAAVWMLRPAPAPQAPPTTRPAQVDSLAQAVAGTEVEVASRQLAAGDYREAARRAERALKMDPANPDARRILEQARKVVDGADKAAAAAKAATDAASGATAFVEMVALDPRHPEATLMAPHFEEAVTAGQVEQARQAASDARKAAEAAGAERAPAFGDGAQRVKDAEAASRAGKRASAVRGFYEAHALFERARRR